MARIRSTDVLRMEPKMDGRIPAREITDRLRLERRGVGEFSAARHLLSARLLFRCFAHQRQFFEQKTSEFLNSFQAVILAPNKTCHGEQFLVRPNDIQRGRPVGMATTLDLPSRQHESQNSFDFSGVESVHGRAFYEKRENTRGAVVCLARASNEVSTQLCEPDPRCGNQ